MGMTNRVMLAQGEERGASKTLIWLDGDGPQKFQSFESSFFSCGIRSKRVRQLGQYCANFRASARV
jgi:hypothetical protein